MPQNKMTPASLLFCISFIRQEMASLLCCVVDRIADDILDSCVSDIAKELEHINGEIVDHVYNAEFSVTP